MSESVQCKAKKKMHFLFRLLSIMSSFVWHWTMHDVRNIHIMFAHPYAHTCISHTFIPCFLQVQKSVNNVSLMHSMHTFALRQIRRNIIRNKSDRAPTLNMFHCYFALNHCAQPEAAKKNKSSSPSSGPPILNELCRSFTCALNMLCVQKENILVWKSWAEFGLIYVVKESYCDLCTLSAQIKAFFPGNRDHFHRSRYTYSFAFISFCLHSIFSQMLNRCVCVWVRPALNEPELKADENIDTVCIPTSKCIYRYQLPKIAQSTKSCYVRFPKNHFWVNGKKSLPRLQNDNSTSCRFMIWGCESWQLGGGVTGNGVQKRQWDVLMLSE